MSASTEIIAAKNARVILDKFALSAARWQVTVTTEEADTTSAEDTFTQANVQEGQDVVLDTVFKNRVKGAVDAEIEIEGFWDALNQPFDPPVTLKPGDQVKDVLLYVEASGTTDVSREVNFDFPKVLVRSAVIEAQVRGLVKYTITACNQGPFFYPLS